jgi:arginine deiminase
MIAEWIPPRTVLVYKPSYEVKFAVLKPSYLLFDRPPILSEMTKEHDILVRTLRNFGINVIELREYITKRASEDKDLYNELKSLINIKDNLPPEELLDIIILNPNYNDEISVKPLTNLYFTRDQQIILKKKALICRMAKPQRRDEVRIMKIFWKSLGFEVIEIKDGNIEGGDFIPAGEFALLGIGPRTDIRGAEELMNKMREFNEIALLYHPNFHDPEIFMHLDMIIGIPIEDLVITPLSLTKDCKANLYELKERGYIKRNSMDFNEFLSKKGFRVINISILEAMAFATNFLKVKESEILVVDVLKSSMYVLNKFRDIIDILRADYERLKANGTSLSRLSEYGLNLHSLDLPNLTAGRGGIHCMTQSIYD